MTVRSIVTVAALLLAAPLSSLACGVCIEDKVAATYDHQVIAKAMLEDHTVLFLEVTGLASGAPQMKQFISGVVEGARGVDHGSARVSLDQAAVSFAFNSNAYTPQDVIKRISQKLSSQHINVKLIRILKKGKLSEPV